MAYKLAVENTVKVPVKFNLNNGGKISSFSFSLMCDRISQDEINAAVEDKESKAKDFIAKVAKSWLGQTLVLDDDGSPAPFCSESLDAMLDVIGVAGVIYLSYLKECGAKEKN
jgi:hypothetical protein